MEKASNTLLFNRHVDLLQPPAGNAVLDPYNVHDTKDYIQVFLISNDKVLINDFVNKFGANLKINVFESENSGFAYLKQNYPPDTIIIDRKMNGFKFIETVRSLEWTKNIPIILITEQITGGLIQEARKIKIDDIFPKDFSSGDLLERINYFQKRMEFKANNLSESVNFNVRIPFWKRAFDVLSTGTALLLLSPLLIVVSILIKLDSKGPIVYKSKRVGAGYKIFEIYKFRSMRTDADQLIKQMDSLNMYSKATDAPKQEGLCDNCKAGNTGECQQKLYLDGKVFCEKQYNMEKEAKVAFMKFQNDPRITKLGHFLRNSSIDELPQLFNIFFGDMSLVGNRPLPLYEAEKLTTDAYIQRFAGPGGLTGLWQVTKRGKGKKDMTEEERIQLDIEYAKNFSMKMDISIILKTFPALFQSENV